MIDTRKKGELVHIVLTGLFLTRSVVSLAQIEDTTRYPPSIKLEEVSVVGHGTSSPFKGMTENISIISGDEIKNSPALSLQDLLDYAACIDIRQRNVHGVQADIEFRGGTFDQVLVLLNGINVTDPQTGHFNLNLPVELSTIERIEIIPGNRTKTYGINAYKGIINIITRKKENYAGAGLSIGQFNLFHTHINGNLVKGKCYNGMSFSRNISEGYTDNTDYRLKHLYYQGGLNLKPLEFNWQAGMNLKTYGANDFYSPSFPDQFEETATGFSSLSISAGNNIKLFASGHWRRHKDHFMLKRHDPSFYENHHLTDVFGINLNTWIPSKLGKSFAGLEARHETIYSTVLGYETDHPVKIKGTDHVFYTKTFYRNTYNSYLEHQYSYKGLSVSGNMTLRIDSDHSCKGDIFPGLSISHVFPGDKLKLHTSVNRAMRLPTFTDLFYKDPVNEGNTELEPEELTSFEIGFEYKLKSIITDFSLFSDYGKQVIDWVWLPDKHFYKAMNITEINTRGIEISCDFERPVQNTMTFIPGKTGFSYAFITSDKSAGEYESKYSLDYLKHKLRIYMLVDITQKVHVNCQIRFNSRNGSYLDYNPDTGNRYAVPFRPYWLIDTKIYYSFHSLNFFTGATNLLNTKYTDVGNLVQPGRWVFAGFEFIISSDKVSSPGSL